MPNSVVLYLSSKGASFDLKLVNDDEFRDLDIQKDHFHPYLKKAIDCKTHQAVLGFLKGIPQNADFQPWHLHNRKYPDHSLNIGFGMVKGRAHECPIKKMINFVELRIKEKNSLPCIIFDKIGKILARAFHYLSKGTAFPFFGIIPGLMRAIIGVCQTITGLALTILFAIPAYCFNSEGAQIVVQRSVKHVLYGPLNVGIGTLQGIPFLGTWIYNQHINL